MFSCAVRTVVRGWDRRRTKNFTTRPVSRAEMTVPSRTPMICPRNSSRDSPAASATQPTSKAIFTLPKLWPVRSGHHLDKGLAGVHDHVGDHRQGYAEAHDGRARQGHGYMDGVAFHRDKPRQPQAKVREPAEQKRQGDLQRLDGLKIPAQQEYMAQDQQTVLHDQTDAHGHPLKPTAHNVCHRGGR